MLCAQAWKPGSQHAGEKRGVWECPRQTAAAQAGFPLIPETVYEALSVSPSGVATTGFQQGAGAELELRRSGSSLGPSK